MRKREKKEGEDDEVHKKKESRTYLRLCGTNEVPRMKLVRLSPVPHTLNEEIGTLECEKRCWELRPSQGFDQVFANKEKEKGVEEEKVSRVTNTAWPRR